MGDVTFINNKTKERFDFDIVKSTMGPNSIDISDFYKKTKMFTYDEGLTSTSICKSKITFIDGLKGKLLYRGYDVSYLVRNKTFLDVAYLFLNEALPSIQEREDFDLEIRKRSFLNRKIVEMFKTFPDRAHPMALMVAGVSILSTLYYEHLDIKTDKEYHEMAYRMLAKIPTIAAFAYRENLGIPVIHPNINLSFTHNFLNMLRAYPYENLELKSIEVTALDSIFMLHIDHEQNASTTTVRTVASTGAHPYAAISAAISALWGRAHGGANESVVAQLKLIGDVKNVHKYIAKAKDPKDPFRLMGFGHRVYKNFDPRALILKDIRNKLRNELGIDTKLLEIADKIEEIALKDEYFLERKLYPNIDFYSGTILLSLKIPQIMFTPIFVIGRTVGWVSHYLELKTKSSKKLIRPRQIYIGSKEKIV